MQFLVWDFLSKEGFQPHGVCLLWRADVFWAHLGSDLIIALSYFSIPLALGYLAYKRRDLIYGWVLYLFIAFIIFCGMTHAMSIWTLWVPDYGLEAIVKVATAAVSLGTAIALWPLMPRLIALPSSAQLSGANARLAREVEDRSRAQHDLRRLNETLEARVAARTSELEQLNADLREARQAADRSNFAKSEFLANMSHEIRTPMTAVLGMIDLLTMEPLEGKQKDYLAVARGAATTLLRIIDDVLDHSRLEARAVKLQSAPFRPDQVLRDVVALLAETAQRKGLELTHRVADDLPDVLEADAVRLRQVLLNLVGNAVKFTDQGSVSLSARALPVGPGRVSLVVEVTDTGPGVAPRDEEAIFARFSQADGSVTRRFGGTGLGLAICRQLVDLMGGELGLRSVPGEGSVFWFSVPCGVKALPAQVAGGGETAGPAPPVERMRVLIVDDNETNRFLLRAMLTKFGHSVEIAGDGIEAVAAVEGRAFDVVLMDVNMPRMDGLTATQRIRAMTGAKAQVPIVALTANAMRGDREAYLAVGMTDYVAKPFEPVALFGVLRRAVSGTRMT